MSSREPAQGLLQAFRSVKMEHDWIKAMMNCPKCGSEVRALCIECEEWRTPRYVWLRKDSPQGPVLLCDRCGKPAVPECHDCGAG